MPFVLQWTDARGLCFVYVLDALSLLLCYLISWCHVSSVFQWPIQIGLSLFSFAQCKHGKRLTSFSSYMCNVHNIVHCVCLCLFMSKQIWKVNKAMDHCNDRKISAEVSEKSLLLKECIWTPWKEAPNERFQRYMKYVKPNAFSFLIHSRSL